MGRDAILEKIGAIAEECEAASYRRGWNDAVSQIVTAAGLKVPMPNATTIIDEVEQVVCRGVGMKGHDVTDTLLKSRPNRDRNILDRSVRTALRRLEHRGVLEKRGGGWFKVITNAEE